MSVFITFEGGDGSGKSTQAKLLSAFLEEQDFDVLMTHEPGGTTYGELFRHLLLDVKSKGVEVDIIAQVLGFCSARAQLVAEQILPRLNKPNTITISDRYADSTIAYQVYGGEILDLREDIEKILIIATRGIKPDLTIFLDISPEDGRKRIEGRVKQEEEPHSFGPIQLSFLENNDFDQKAIQFHHAVRDGYYSIIQREPHRWWIIDANRSIEVIQKEIQDRIIDWLKQKDIYIKTQKHKKHMKSPEDENAQKSRLLDFFEAKV
jgi:dTMP kinase